MISAAASNEAAFFALWRSLRHGPVDSAMAAAID
jgi:hypothetical protein